MPDPIIEYTPVQHVCSGRIVDKIDDTESYEVNIYASPIGEFNGPVYATLIYSPGSSNNYKPGDYVKILTTFSFGGDSKEILDIMPGAAYYILGMFTERSSVNVAVTYDNSEVDESSIGLVNSRSGAGIILSDNRTSTITPGGASFAKYLAGGYGTSKESSFSKFQNFHRVIGDNPPFYFSREYFGMYSGADLNSESSNMSGEDFPIVFRRFVTDSKDIDNWVSSCEGAFAPWVGANVECDEISPGKETLFSKVINKDNKRVSIEIGGDKKNFINIRLDDVLTSEKAFPVAPGATPAILGNRFKFTVDDDGGVELRAAGKGIPASNFNGTLIKISPDGELSILASKSITLSHGDTDDTINSIVLDPNKGIDITAKNGFRVNGLELVTTKFLDWMTTFKKSLCLVTAVGGPAPMHPLAEVEYDIKTKSIGSAGGFTTLEKGVPATGVIADTDVFLTV